jgi:hypothetical protein
MRKIVIVAGLLLGAAMFSGTSANAAYMGCLCAKIGAPAVCTPTVISCNTVTGGVCISPCTYEEPKKPMRHARKKKKK